MSGQRIAPTTRWELAARKGARSSAILQAVQKIDTAPSPAAQAEIVRWLTEAYETRGAGVLLGLFGHCYLGHPHVDHMIALDGSILTHYTAAQSVPPPFLPARPLATSTAYAYIEVYADGSVIPVRPDGTPVL